MPTATKPNTCPDCRAYCECRHLVCMAHIAARCPDCICHD